MIHIRNARPSDHQQVIDVVDDWWGGREVANMLPRLFFVHFCDTSFVAECERKVVGFVVGFLSQSVPNEAYIHFAGVDPRYRQSAIGRQLYERFFESVLTRGFETVRCVTSPLNATSIAFHSRLGFAMEPQIATVDGLPVAIDYDGRGHDRVQFVKQLSVERERKYATCYLR